MRKLGIGILAFVVFASTAFAVQTGVGSVENFNGNALNYQNIYLRSVAQPFGTTTATLAGLGAGNVDDGVHRYRLSYVTAFGETDFQSSFASVTVTDKTTDGQVSLSLLTGTDTRVTGRKIYRTKVGNTTNYWLVGTVSNNTETTFLDNVADADLTIGGVPTKDNLAVGRLRVANNFTDFQYLFLGNYNTGLGFNALASLTYGTGNYANGNNAMNLLTTGSYNTGDGYNTGQALTTGSSNTLIGAFAGWNLSTASGSTFIGYRAGFNETGSDKLYIDNSDTATPLIYGDFVTNVLTFNGDTNITGDSYFTGSGSGFPFGSMYNDNADFTVVISGAGVDTEVDGGFTTGELNLTTFPDDHYIVVSKAGRYKIDYSMSLLTASVANKTIEGFIMIDGTRQAPGTSHAEVSPGGSNRPETVSGTAIINLTANQQISLGIHNHDDGTDVVVNHGSLTTFLMGG